MQWKRAGPLSCYPLYSHEFESHGRHSFKVFPHLNVWGCIFFMWFLLFFVCCLFVLIFVGFLYCISLLCCFILIFFYFILNFNRKRQNNIIMKFQDASCPKIAASVLSSSVEPPSQSQAVNYHTFRFIF